MGVTVVGRSIPRHGMPAKDKRDLEFAIEAGVDYVGQANCDRSGAAAAIENLHSRA